MPLVKVQEKGQIALPAKIRHAIGLNSGDLVMIEKEGDRIVLIPQAVVARDPVTDAAIAEGLQDIRAGRVTPAFPNMEALEAWLQSDEGKEFSKAGMEIRFSRRARRDFATLSPGLKGQVRKQLALLLERRTSGREG